MSSENNKNGKLHIFKREFSKVVIVEAFKQVLSLLFTAGLITFIIQFPLSYFKIIAKYKWPISILIFLGSSWLFIVLYQKFHKHRPNYKSINFDYHLLKKELFYEFEDEKTMIYKKKITLKALKNGLDVYRDKYNWTGKGHLVVDSSIHEQKFRHTFKKNIWQFYEIQFPMTLSKGNEIDTEIKWNLKDDEASAVPFFSSTIEEPLDLLELNLLLPPKLGIKQVTCEVSNSIGAKKPLKSERKDLDRDGKIKWIIKSPKLLHHYEINWVPVSVTSPPEEMAFSGEKES